jgi:hypothetical protein
MKKIPLTALMFLMIVLCAFTPAGMGQGASEFGADQLSNAVKNQDLDAYWADSTRWMEYGYRPQVKANITPWSTAPSYFAGKDNYSYGTDLPVPSLANPLEKKSVQLTKYGTWH